MSTETSSSSSQKEGQTTEELYEEHKEAFDDIAEDEEAPETIRALARAVQRRATEGSVDAE